MGMVIISEMDQHGHADNRESGPDSRGNARPAGPVSVVDLLGNRSAVWLEHRGEHYLLRVTRNGKLILTK